MAYDTTRLLAQVNLKGALPSGRFTDAEILDLATDALTSLVVPLINSTREEYYVLSSDISTVSGTASYNIPDRAVGQVLREVKLISGTEIVDLTRLDPEDITSTQSGTPFGFYLQANKIVLYPTPDSASTTLRVTYFGRTGYLIATTSAAAITAIAGNVITCVPPSTWTNANTFDIIGGSWLRGYDLAATTVAGGSITFTATVPSDLAVGDYVALAGYSPIPQCPVEAHALLVQLTVVACLEAMGDQTNLGPAKEKADMLAAALKGVLQNRIQGAGRRFTQNLI
jgi:hypothetical protein